MGTAKRNRAKPAINIRHPHDATGHRRAERETAHATVTQNDATPKGNNVKWRNPSGYRASFQVLCQCKERYGTGYVMLGTETTQQNWAHTQYNWTGHGCKTTTRQSWETGFGSKQQNTRNIYTNREQS